MDMEKLVALCRRRGFIFQSSEIYGGINGFWDYGPLGVELKKNIKDAWWQDMVRNPPPGPDGQEISMVGLDCSIIMNPKVWEASGHVKGFQDPMQTCHDCKKLVREDQVWSTAMESEWVKSLVEILPLQPATEAPDPTTELGFKLQRCGPPNKVALTKWAKNKGPKLAPGLQLVKNPDHAISNLDQRFLHQPEQTLMIVLGILSNIVGKQPCPNCGGDLTEARPFNLMFDTIIGAVRDEENKAYLRPETAQGIFVNFRNVLDSTRLKLPFGIAQIGKAFRNEVTPRNFIFRSREFEQMEIEFFCHPSDSMKWYQYWRDLRKSWYTRLGIKSDNLRPREQGKEELAHYSIGTTDIEYMFPFSKEPQELEGVAHRGDYDLKAHQAKSGKDMSYFDEEAWERDKAGRGTNSFKEWLKKNPPAEEVAKYQFVPHVVEPSAGADRFTLAVLCEAYAEEEVEGETRTVMRFHPRLAPIKAGILPLVNKEGMPDVAQKLYRELKSEWNVFYDDKGAIGRRYRRQDEAGTPWCFTIDGQTLQDHTVTLRDRDSLKQERIPLKDVADELRRRLKA